MGQKRGLTAAAWTVKEPYETARHRLTLPARFGEQVLLSVGYPPTHRTPSINAPEWIYWNNRWMTYKVVFDDRGMVTYTIGSAPTRNEPVSWKP